MIAHEEAPSEDPCL